MKIIKQTTTPAGKRRVTVDLDDDEILIGIDPDKYYRLGDPMDDVVLGDMLEVTPVSWCSVSQQWVE